ncbi:hypothetical protein IPM65_03150 [Candidatus Roizmanbacteria bacterium]|nr:MAG: hypothetical protein IPM65_03150 [Candidatus Roizmanbacteria bacterium]
MIEALHAIIPFINSRDNDGEEGSVFSKGRWGFRYDPKQREGWSRVGDDYRRMIEGNQQNFWNYLQSQSPAEQYAVLELISQPAFGSQNNGDVKPQVEPKQVGSLYADLIRSHFRIPSGSPEKIQEAEQRKTEFFENAWRLTIPQTALMFTVLKITPDLSASVFTEDVIPYVQGIVHQMGEQAKRNLGDQTINQLERLGIFCKLE